MLTEILFSILFAYLIGSFSPGFFFGWLIKGIDIRKYGNKNTGATNTYNTVGGFYGVLVALIDISKGGLVFLLANLLIGSTETALLVSLIVIIGHNYPFYLGFRGGNGTATSWGLIITALFFTQSLIALIVLVFILIRSIKTSRKLKFIKPARKLYRLSGFLLPLWYWFFGQNSAFVLSLILVILFIVFDIIRLSSRKFNVSFFKKFKKFVKPKEKRFVSTTTLFLVSASAVIYLFSLEIAIISITFFLIGDTMAEIFGKAYRKFMFGRKSIEGSAFGFVFCFLAGIFLIGPLGISLSFVFKGALFASLIEFFSQKIDDNLTMPFGIALLLRLFA